MLTTVTTKGQVTIPEEVRMALNVVPGDKLYVERYWPETKRLMVRVVKRIGMARKLAGSLKTRVKMPSIEIARKKVAGDIAKYYGLAK